VDYNINVIRLSWRKAAKKRENIKVRDLTPVKDAAPTGFAEIVSDDFLIVDAHCALLF
jgi:hypothetical protein